MLKSGHTKNADGTKVGCYRCTVCRRTFPLNLSSAELYHHEEHCFPKGYLKTAKSLVGRYFIRSKAYGFFSCAITYGFKVTDVTDDEIRIDVVGDGITGPYIKFKDTISYDDMVRSKEIDRKSYEKFITEKLDGWKFNLCPWLVPEKTEEEKYADKYIPRGRLKGTEHSTGSPIKMIDSDSDFDYLVRNLDRMLKSKKQGSISFVKYKEVYNTDEISQRIRITYDPLIGFEMSVADTNGKI